MGFLSFISKLIGLERRWKGTPEQYLAMVQYIAKKNNLDCENLAENVKPYESMDEKVVSITKKS